MTASLCARFRASLSRAITAPSLFKSLCPSQLRLVYARRAASTLRVASKQPVSEMERIHRVESVAMLAQIYGYINTSLMTVSFWFLLLKLWSLENSLESLNKRWAREAFGRRVPNFEDHEIEPAERA